MNYFEGISSAGMKEAYRRLASTLHPDKGGSTSSFQEMKRQYEYWERWGQQDTFKRHPEKPKGSPAGHKKYSTSTCTLSGWMHFSPRLVANDHDSVTDIDGNMFGFKHSWWTQQRQERKIGDSTTNSYVHILGVFAVRGPMTASVTLDAEIGGSFKADVYNDGVHIGTMTISTKDLKQHQCKERMSVTMRVPSSKMQSVMTIRPEIEWEFEQDYVTISVTIPPKLKKDGVILSMVKKFANYLEN